MYKEVFGIYGEEFTFIYSIDRLVGLISPLLAYYIFKQRRRFYLKLQSIVLVCTLCLFHIYTYFWNADNKGWIFLLGIEILLRICQVVFRDNFYAMFVRLFSKDSYKAGFNVVGFMMHCGQLILEQMNYFLYNDKNITKQDVLYKYLYLLLLAMIGLIFNISSKLKEDDEKLAK